MLEPFLGEIAWVAFDFAPEGWLICDGRSLPVAQYAALYSLIGNRFGGNSTTFQLPNLLGRTMIGPTNQAPLGSAGGNATCTLGIPNMPNHNHAATFTPSGGVGVNVGLQGQSGVASNKLSAIPKATYTLANTDDPSIGGSPLVYAPPNSGTSVALGGVAATVNSNIGGSVTVAATGGSQPFSIMQPYLPLLPIIACTGVYPTRP